MGQSSKWIECGRLTSALLMRRMVVQLRPKVLVLGGGASLKPLFFQLFRSRILEAIKFFLLSDERITRIKKISNGYFYYKYLRSLSSTKSHIYYPVRLRMRVLSKSFSFEKYRKSLAILGLGQDGHVAGLFEERVSFGKFSLSFGPEGVLRKSLSEKLIRSINKKVLYHSRLKDWEKTKLNLPTSVVSKLGPHIILIERTLCPRNGSQ